MSLFQILALSWSPVNMKSRTWTLITHTNQILRPVTFYETREERCLILSFQKQIAVVVDGHCNLFGFFFSFCMNDLVPPSASGGNVTVLYMEWVWVSLLTPLRHLLHRLHPLSFYVNIFRVLALLCHIFWLAVLTVIHEQTSAKLMAKQSKRFGPLPSRLNMTARDRVIQLDRPVSRVSGSVITP
jgi:hypothetical protein